ncbi:unnamed protein product [Acanthoscelides obtectus]|uniref:Uncharacterized protein n=1 Tax=Acanthoscelides obtectus TaxID=200917 RepID=A0A9P0PNP3_ACAOB|nr:unnamed protein product [Acanthoscelides obtectus]CAK1669527.1 hypothetical protein AOBTE_LOCUS27054 [Acanthoscelides obtectus]
MCSTCCSIQETLRNKAVQCRCAYNVKHRSNIRIVHRIDNPLLSIVFGFISKFYGCTPFLWYVIVLVRRIAGLVIFIPTVVAGQRTRTSEVIIQSID